MRRLFLLMVVVSVVALGGCSAKPSGDRSVVEAQGPDQEALPVVKEEKADTVIVEGVAVPARWSELRFEIPGEVVQVPVDTGDSVSAGALLVRLDTREMSLALRSAEQDVSAQEAALRQLVNGASKEVVARADKANADQVAQARVALEAKELQLDQARNEDPAIAVNAAQARVDQLQLSLTRAQAQDPAPGVTQAQVVLERARIALTDTQDEYNKALDRPWEDQDIRDTWAKRLEQAQLDFTSAQAQLNAAQNEDRAYQVGLQVMAAQIEEAKAQLDQALVAQDNYSTTLAILTAEVKGARMNVEALETQDNPYRDKASAEEIAQAKAMLEKARIAVEQLRVQMEDAELRAPFDGTVADVLVKKGDQVSLGQVVVALATLGQLEVHTTDLTELDVAPIAVGQPVRLTLDALPDREFRGTVDEIALRSGDYRGDVVYQVIVSLDEPGETTGLRWGMTVVAEIDTGGE
jgi:HlyD family secretion protein